MTTIEDVLDLQRQYGVLVAPAVIPPPDAPVPTGPALSSRTSDTLNVALTNTTGSGQVYAYVTGLAINNSYAVFLLQSDGETPYYPASPTNTQTALAVDCSIAITGVGSTRNITIPQLAGGRIWFSVGKPLTFLLNPGPGLVEPSVTNTSDPNYNLSWDFCEFTFNSEQLFVNISHVDFVGLPISLSLTNTSGGTQTVPGLPSSGLSTIVSGLQAQQAKDSAGWAELIVPASSGGTLRVLSPNSGITMQPSLFKTYWQSYVDSVWTKYATTTLTVDTQAEWGVVTGQVDASSGDLAFANIGSIPQPSSADIFSCSSGAFAATPTNTAAMGNICARIAAAFNRSTLLIDTDQPDGESVDTYYQDPVTNHYARLCHAATPDSRGYAFPYDDVGNASTPDQKGAISDGSPALLSVAVGGGTVSSQAVAVREMARQGRQMPGGHKSGPRLGRRDLSWGWRAAEEEKAALAECGDDDARQIQGDPEKGALAAATGSGGAIARPTQLLSSPLQSLVPASIARRAEDWMQRLEQSPVYAYTKPVLDVLTRLLLAVLSLSVRTVLGRLGVVLALVLLTILLGLYGRVAGTGSGNDV